MKSLKAAFSLLASCAFLLAADESQPTTTPEPSKDTPKRRVVVVKPIPDMKYKLIPLGEMSYETVDSICRPWLSEGSTMVHEESRKSVLIYDTPEVVAKVAKFILDTQGSPINVRIEVDYVGASAGKETSLDIDVDRGRPSHQKLVWKDGKLVHPSTVEIAARKRSDTGSRLDSMILVTGNGLPASLWAGKTIIDPTWLRAQRLVPDTYIVTPGGSMFIPGTDVDFKWTDVGSKLMIRPVYQEATGNVTVELYPSISYLDGKGRRQAVKVESLTTTITVKEGQRVYIGELISARKNDFLNVFGPEIFNSTGSSSALDIYVTCYALTPGDKRNGKPSLRFQ